MPTHSQDSENMKLTLFHRTYSADSFSSNSTNYTESNDDKYSACVQFKVILANVLLGLCWNLINNLLTSIILQCSINTLKDQLLHSSLGSMLAFIFQGITFERDDYQTLQSSLVTLVIYSCLANAISTVIYQEPGVETFKDFILIPMLTQVILSSLIILVASVRDFLQMPNGSESFTDRRSYNML